MAKSYFDNISRTSFPIQKLAISKKGKQWKEACVDYLVGKERFTYSSTSERSYRDELKIKYDLYNGKYTIEDLKHVTNPFNVDDKFPATPQNFNIIRPKLELLIGEMTKRPYNVKVVKAGDGAVSELEDRASKMFTNYVMQEIEKMSSKVNPQTGQLSDKDNMTLENIQDYLEMDFCDVAEKTATSVLDYLRKELKLDNEFLKIWKDGLVAGIGVSYVGIINGEPVSERVNPMYFTYDKDPDLEFIEDGTWAVRRMLMTPESIYDRFYDLMDEKELDKLLDSYSNQNSKRSTGSSVNYDNIYYKDTPMYTDDIMDGAGEYINVWHVVWKSFKKIGFLTQIDEAGEEETIIVDETYKFDEQDKSEGSTISWDWVEEIWEGYRIGDDQYLGIRPIENQQISIDNPNSRKLPYYGITYSDTNSKNKSLVDLMKPLQYMYIVIWYRLELAIARDKGRILNMDITQIPKSMGVDIDRWLHYMNATGINFINPYDEGWDVPGREGGKPSSFNTISSQDLSMTAIINDYIMLMDKIEAMAGEISGVTRQREGSISTNELVGNVERAVIQSSHITEPLFWKHSQLVKNILTALLNTAKIAWSDSDKTKLQYITDDLSRVFFNITDDFVYSDFAVYLSDSTKDSRNIDMLKNLLQPAMQNGASLLDAAAIITDDNMSSIKRKLSKIEKQRMEREQRMEQAAQEAQRMQAEQEAQIRAEENRITEEDSIRKAETALQVAYINASAKQQNNENTDDNGFMDLSKLQLQKDKQNKDYEMKRRQLEETIRKNKTTEKQKEKEIAIKKKQANKSNVTSK